MPSARLVLRGRRRRGVRVGVQPHPSPQTLFVLEVVPVWSHSRRWLPVLIASVIATIGHGLAMGAEPLYGVRRSRGMRPSSWRSRCSGARGHTVGVAFLRLLSFVEVYWRKLAAPDQARDRRRDVRRCSCACCRRSPATASRRSAPYSTGRLAIAGVAY